MLRVVSSICTESRALELLISRREAFAVFRRTLHGAAPLAAAAQTVLTSEGEAERQAPPPAAAPPPQSPPPPPPPPPRRAWPAAALAAVLTASLGGVYFYRKMNDDPESPPLPPAEKKAEGEPPIPALGAAFPGHVPYLIVGAGTAAFAAMRAIRAARPDAKVLLVGEERALPYMRPPLSKELWREPDLAQQAKRPDTLTFRQWNGKRRPVVYEPAAFYTPVEELGARELGGASVARGWRVTKLDVTGHTAQVTAPGQDPITIRYDKCLIATGVRPRRVPALAEAAAAGRSMTLRGLGDAVHLAAALDDQAVKTVVVVGGGFLATELSAALADRLQDSGRRVVQVIGESAPMAGVLPGYLAEETARRLRAAGVELLPNKEIEAGALKEGAVQLRLSGGEALSAGLVVEAVGSEPDGALALQSGLETHAELGGLVVSAELQARTDVYVAGDAACFYDVALGRRRVEHHDHAVVSGRLAGENMAAVAPPRHYTHQSMFWSDLGPQLGYEAIGIIDSRLPTVGVFSADAAPTTVETPAEIEAEAGTRTEAQTSETRLEATRRYERGVVFYLKGQRIVGVLLWNLFNRMHIARQVLAQGEFEDLFEVGKLFSPHEED